ncbi:3'-5' exonuclease [Coemansia sp. RSA 2320]|nr:3'-5' exonuclease [Coemansia sp. RSA 2320]
MKTKRQLGVDDSYLEDGPEDTILSVDKLAKKKRKGKRSKTDYEGSVDDIVDALLLDKADKKATKKKKSKSKQARGVSLLPVVDGGLVDAVDYNDDDVADLYAWDSAAEEEEGNGARRAEEAGKPDDGCPEASERKRALQLAMAAADDDERRGGSDAPRDEDDWFAKLDEDAAAGRQQQRRPAEDEEEDGDLPVDLVRAPGSQAQRRLPASVSREKREALGRYLAIDCEMVGAGLKGSRSMLARVSIVNYYGHVVLDTFVKPLEPVTDYRTWVSGIRKADLVGARAFALVQAEVAELIRERVVVGHAIKNDLAALMLTHPPLLTRDTSRYEGFRKLNKGSAPSLRKLAASVLSITIQEGEHSSVTDAKTTMLLYRKAKDDWEKILAPKRYKVEIKLRKSKERFAQLRQEIHDQQNQ